MCRKGLLIWVEPYITLYLPRWVDLFTLYILPIFNLHKLWCSYLNISGILTVFRLQDTGQAWSTERNMSMGTWSDHRDITVIMDQPDNLAILTNLHIMVLLLPLFLLTCIDQCCPQEPAAAVLSPIVRVLQAGCYARMKVDIGTYIQK